MLHTGYLGALLAVVLLNTNVQIVVGHGRLMDPPSRNSMWRFGFPNPVNYNDNELYCGGFITHAVKNKGKCGVCGDNYQDTVPRSHEAGGVYSNGIITQRYLMGQEIRIEAELTTNHYGSMKIELCVNNDFTKPATEECFKNVPLADGETPEFVIPKNSKKKGTFVWNVKLPDNVICNHCIMRWTYKAGNNWEKCSDGSSKVGCGDQETFINCADIVILSNTPTANINPWQVWVTKDYPDTVTNDVSHLWSRNELRPLIVRHQLCVPKDEFAHIPGMAALCIERCLAYPPKHCAAQCRCVDDCTAIGEFRGVEGEFWCQRNCLRHPSNCPKEKCSCK